MIHMRDIRIVARRIGKEFAAERVILFGSYAYGQPTEDSDVDLLVIRRFTGRPEHVSVRIRMSMDIPFPADILVRTPAYVRHRLRMGDCFIKDVIEQGKVLYESTSRGVGGQGRRRLRQHAARVAVA